MSLFGALVDAVTDAAEATVKGAVALPGKVVRGAVEGAAETMEAVVDVITGTGKP